MAASGHISEMRPLTTRSINTCLDENDQIDDSKFIGRRGHGSVISTSRFWQIRLPHPSWPPPTFPNLNNFVSVAACDTTSSTTISVSTWSPFPYLHFFMIVLLPCFRWIQQYRALTFPKLALQHFDAKNYDACRQSPPRHIPHLHLYVRRPYLQRNLVVEWGPKNVKASIDDIPSKW
jgi:hypothetical protein